MGYDPMGTMDWYSFADGLYYTLIGIIAVTTAVATAAAVFGCPYTAPAMYAFVLATCATGVATIVNGAAEFAEA